MQRAGSLSALVLVIAGPAVLASGCASGLHVEPASVRPGMTVRLRADRSVFAGQGASVRIGGKTAAVVRRVSDREVDVIVPAVTPGAVRVELGKGGRSGQGNVTVLPSPSLKLVVSLEGGKVKLLASTPRAGEAGIRVLRDQVRLSYDVINQQGGLVFTAAIADPTRREVFDGPNAGGAKLHGSPPTSSAVFAIKVPNVPGRFSVKFYRVEAGVDLATEAGRAQRISLGEITVERKETP